MHDSPQVRKQKFPYTKKKESGLATNTEKPVRFKNSNLGQVFIITLFGLLAHGLLLFTDYQVWDSFIVGFFSKHQQHWEHLVHFCSDYGRPLDSFFYLPFKGNQQLIFLSKVAGFFLWIGTFLLINSTLSPLLGISHPYDFLVALVGVTLPFYEYLGEFVFNIYIIPYFLFWLGIKLYLGSITANLPISLILRGAALFVFWFSFAFNALILFYLTIILTYLFLNSWIGSTFCLQSLLRKLLRNTDFILIPFAFWIHKSIYCPLQGYPAQAEYNIIQKTLFNYLTGSFVSLSAIIARVFSAVDSLDIFFTLATLSLVLYIVALVFRTVPNALIPNFKMVSLKILLGCVLLVAILFPYIAVGKPYGAFGYDSRMGIGLNMPIALIIVMFAFFLQCVIQKWNRIWLVFIVVCCAYGIIESNRNYLRLTGYFAKQQSIVSKIQKAVNASPDTSVVHMREYYQMPKTTLWVPAVAWTYMTARGPSLPTFLVVDSRNFLPDKQATPGQRSQTSSFPFVKFSPEDIENFCWLSSIPYTLQKIPRQGGTLNIAAFEGSSGNNAEEIGRFYLFQKWFGTNSDMDSFLSSLTKVFLFDKTDKVQEI